MITLPQIGQNCGFGLDTVELIRAALFDLDSASNVSGTVVEAADGSDWVRSMISAVVPAPKNDLLLDELGPAPKLCRFNVFKATGVLLLKVCGVLS